MNYLKIDKTSISNGPGVRVVLWVSGCSIHCKGCQNSESWDINAGRIFDKAARNELFEAMFKPYINGLTLSGGHPLEYENLADVYNLIVDCKLYFPQQNIWLYTGRTLTIHDFDTSVDLAQHNYLLRNHILAMCDVVVDGPYIEEQRDITLKFRGSSNQRLIDVKKTIAAGEIVLFDC